MKVTSPAVRSVASGTRSGHLHGSKPEAQPLGRPSVIAPLSRLDILDVEVITSEVRGYP